jgi:hypothetical protein
MELEELHVGDGGPGSIAEGYAVAAGSVGIAGVEIGLADASCGYDRGVAGKGEDLAILDIEGVDADTTVLAHPAQAAAGDQVYGDMMFENDDRGTGPHGGDKGLLDLFSGDVARVDDAPFVMAALAAEMEVVLVGGVAYLAARREMDALVDQPLDVLWPPRRWS